jgi:hypothetical protein
MKQILLESQHEDIVNAAIEFGAWLMAECTLDEQAISTIQSIQKTLRELPSIADGTLAMYGLSIEKGTSDEGLIRGWDVAVEYFADDPQQQAGLECFSSYLPMPEPTSDHALALKAKEEVYFNWPVASPCNAFSADDVARWCRELANPLQFYEEGDRLRVELVYGSQYVELDF